MRSVHPTKNVEEFPWESGDGKVLIISLASFIVLAKAMNGNVMSSNAG